jgi:hypothetical protein
LKFLAQADILASSFVTNTTKKGGYQDWQEDASAKAVVVKRGAEFLSMYLNTVLSVERINPLQRLVNLFIRKEFFRLPYY